LPPQITLKKKERLFIQLISRDLFVAVGNSNHCDRERSRERERERSIEREKERSDVETE
jgi:hypothetical protein